MRIPSITTSASLIGAATVGSAASFTAQTILKNGALQSLVSFSHGSGSCLVLGGIGIFLLVSHLALKALKSPVYQSDIDRYLDSIDYPTVKKHNIILSLFEQEQEPVPMRQYIQDSFTRDVHNLEIEPLIPTNDDISASIEI